MDIFVCIKQVPSTNKVQVDEKTGVLKRSGIQSKMNPYDLYALETALRLKALHGGTVTVGTMGPPQAQAIIREAYMMGADDGYVFSDRRLGGADVLATSYTLSQAIQSVGDFDLILCGKQTTDGDTAQVGAELAEFLGITHVTNVCRIHEVTENSITVDLDLPLHLETAKVAFPCLMTVEKGIYEPRLPSYKLKLATADRPITVLKLDDMEDQDARHYGLNGSPTQVKRIFPPESSSTHEMWNGEAGELTGRLFRFLEDKKFLQQLR